MILLAEEHPADCHLSTISPSPLIEKLWYLHVLETRSYCNMCAHLLPDGNYIHHSALTSVTSGRLGRVQCSMRAYRTRFLAEPPSAVWDTHARADAVLRAVSPPQAGGQDPVARGHGANQNIPSRGEGEPREKPEASRGEVGLREDLQSEGIQTGSACAGDDTVRSKAAVAASGAAAAAVSGAASDLVWIVLRTLTGRTEGLHVRLDMPVEQVVAAYHRSSGLPANELRFIFTGRQLETHVTLRGYGIVAGSMLHVVRRCSGC